MSDKTNETVEGAVDDEFDDDKSFDEEPDADAVDEAAFDGDVDEAIEEFGDGETINGETVEEAEKEGEEEKKEEKKEEEEEEEEEEPQARKVTEDEEDDDDEQDPDDVEADLEAILRNRMATADDDEEDEADEATGAVKTSSSTGPRNEEFVCESCFLLVNRSQFGSAKDPRCPMGDPECPSITRIFS